jgi:hypothetical protein
MSSVPGKQNAGGNCKSYNEIYFFQKKINLKKREDWRDI